MNPFRRLPVASVIAGLVATSPLAAQTTFQACRVPAVGVIYMINVGDAPTACLDPGHVQFSWTEGSGTVADGSITTAKLADGAVTFAKLNSAVDIWSLGSAVARTSASTTINAGAFLQVSISCLAGEVAVGGGGSNSASGTVVLTDSFPSGSNPTGWIVYYKNNGATNETVTAWAVCVS